MPKRKEFEQQVWEAFCEACHGLHCCSVCLKDGVSLETGHLLSAADGGSLLFDNLIPVCRSCNAENRKGLTADVRPADWRDRFAKRLMVKLGFGLTSKSVGTLKKECSHSNDLQVIENKGEIDWNSVVFVASNQLFPTDADRLLLTEQQGLDLVDKMIVRARKFELAAPPFFDRKGKLIRFARQAPKDFVAACEAFFYQKPYENGHRDAWAYLCDNYEIYLDEGLAARRRKTERAHLARWQEYILAAACTPWRGMTDEDRKFIASVVAEKESGKIREVKAAELDRSSETVRREFAANKEVMTELLELCDQMNKARPTGFNAQSFRWRLENAKDTKNIVAIRRELDPAYKLLQEAQGPEYQLGYQPSDDPLDGLF